MKRTLFGGAFCPPRKYGDAEMGALRPTCVRFWNSDCQSQAVLISHVQRVWYGRRTSISVCLNCAGAKLRLCENCVTECCTVVMSTAIAMGVLPVSINSFSYLQSKWRTPKAGVAFSSSRFISAMTCSDLICRPSGCRREETSFD